jgi:hypothetical protein
MLLAVPNYPLHLFDVLARNDNLSVRLVDPHQPHVPDRHFDQLLGHNFTVSVLHDYAVGEQNGRIRRDDINIALAVNPLHRFAANLQRIGIAGA